MRISFTSHVHKVAWFLIILVNYFESFLMQNIIYIVVHEYLDVTESVGPHVLAFVLFSPLVNR